MNDSMLTAIKMAPKTLSVNFILGFTQWRLRSQHDEKVCPPALPKFCRLFAYALEFSIKQQETISELTDKFAKITRYSYR
ncbi:hypothetical protein OAS89_00530 [Alphaproteobacteria bacterium]|nr:hypothetical protein [Alphaproteobacteria bacterium]